MASIINASSSGSGGIVQTADASGVLQLQSNGTVALTVSTTRNVTLTSTGATGLVLDTDSSSTSNSSRLFFMNVTNGVSLRSSNTSTDGQLIFSTAAVPDSTSGNARVYLNKFGVGLAAIPSSGTGLSFPSAQDPSSDANTLDDYEEGTWTLTDGSGAGLSFTVLDARYTKIGRMVQCFAQFAYPSTSNGNNSSITGLPFAVANTAGGAYGAFTCYTTYSQATWLCTGSSTSSQVYSLAGAGVTNATLSGKQFRLVWIYEV